METGAWKTEVIPKGERTKEEPEGRRGMVEPKVWRAEAQEICGRTWMMMDPEVEQEDQGIPVEPEG